MKFTWEKIFSLALAAVMALSLAACGGQTQQSSAPVQETAPPADSAVPEESAAPSPEGGQSAGRVNVLVAYFSATGNTGRVANAIAEATGGDLFEITPAQPYTDADLD